MVQHVAKGESNTTVKNKNSPPKLAAELFAKVESPAIVTVPPEENIAPALSRRETWM